MRTIKKGDSSIDVVFIGTNNYTNKLFAKNITFDNGKLHIDYSHYSKRKRGNLEDSDFHKLLNNSDKITKFSINDETVKKELQSLSIQEIEIKLNEEKSPTYPVSEYVAEPGFIKIRI